MEPISTGLGASPGVAVGRARVAPAANGAEVEPGDVLVTVMTDPGLFVGIIQHAAAVVTDQGGLSSHPAILCRELGIPCVVGTIDGTTAIQDGTMISVDGGAGTVHVA